MKEALLFFGGWEGHEPRVCAELFAARLGERGITVQLSDTLECLRDAGRLGEYALIIPCWTMGALEPTLEQNLLAAVAGGTGLAGFHGGMGDAFRGSADYQWMVGGQFVQHPDGVKDYRVEFVKRDDPITRGLDDFAVHTEQYYMHVDPLCEVLATSTFRSARAPWVDGVVMPCVWKKPHGAGRVFYSSLGHKCHEFTDVPVQLELTLRGMEWAARS